MIFQVNPLAEDPYEISCQHDISGESSARRQRIHMKHIDLFSSKDNSKRKIIQCRLLKFHFAL